MRKQNNKPGLLQPEAKPPHPHHWKSEKSAASWVKRDIETQNIVRVMAGFVISAVIIAALYFGQDVLIPLALAILLAFLLEPLVSRLKKWGLPQLPSIAIVMIFTISVLAGLGSYLGFQLKDLSQELPQYQDTIQQKLNTVKSLTSGPSAWDGAKTTFDTVENSFEGINQVEQEKGVQNVKVVGLEQSPSDAAMEWGSKILSPIATIGIVFLFVVLILISRKDLHDRLLRLLGGNLNIGTDVLDEAGQRIGTYLRMQLLVNVTYGIPMAAGLWFIGVPAAIMWGMLTPVQQIRVEDCLNFQGNVISRSF
ncbi:AI-2E family transporter [Acinetobacter indicus]|uniref:AI-2E family transporter n=1 Tax=Acinetobacter indicus TaxID=756892 RepID=UPI001D176EC0|nr:AI-2E family transporter [Acinetobacter indicus]